VPPGPHRQRSGHHNPVAAGEECTGGGGRGRLKGGETRREPGWQGKDPFLDCVLFKARGGIVLGQRGRGRRSGKGAIKEGGRFHLQQGGEYAPLIRRTGDREKKGLLAGNRGRGRKRRAN